MMKKKIIWTLKLFYQHDRSHKLKYSSCPLWNINIFRSCYDIEPRAWFLFHNLQKKKKQTKQVVETGTSNHTDVDYDWIPKESIAATSKSGDSGGIISKPTQTQLPW